MNRTKNENDESSAKKNQPEPGSHLPPDLNRAEIDRAKDTEADLNAQKPNAQQPEDPILQMREGRRRKRQKN
jgi:hypothetical protein